jgi:protein-disulfide isomerase
METQQESKTGLLAAIMFAGIAISVSVAFLGYQMMDNQQASAIDPNIDPDQLAAILQEMDPQEVQSLLEDLAKQVNASYTDLVDDDAVMGDADAPLTLVEFSDYQCPYCQRHFKQTGPQIRQNFIDTGKVKYIFRDFPLSFHSDAKQAAAGAECAREQGGDEMYFGMNDALFKGTQSSIPLSTLTQYADDLGLDTEDFEACVRSGKYDSEVDKDIAAGAAYGINGTPGFVITDGTKSIRLSGALPYSEFVKEFEKMLK